MKLQSLAILASLSLTTNFALASDGGHNGDEASTVACRILDASGHQLASSVQETVVDGALQIAGAGKGFSYAVTFKDANATIKLTNTESGDKLTVREGDFDIDEVVSATLETDEAPGEQLTIECTAH